MISYCFQRLVKKIPVDLYCQSVFVLSSRALTSWFRTWCEWEAVVQLESIVSHFQQDHDYVDPEWNNLLYRTEWIVIQLLWVLSLLWLPTTFVNTKQYGHNFLFVKRIVQIIPVDLYWQLVFVLLSRALTAWYRTRWEWVAVLQLESIVLHFKQEH